MNQVKRKIVFLILVVMIFLSLVPAQVQVASASAPFLDKIRVGLFMSDRDSTPNITLVPSTGAQLSVNYRKPNAVNEWFKTTAPLEVNLNQYILDFGTYSTYAQAYSVYAKLTVENGASYEKTIYVQPTSTGSNFEVLVGASNVDDLNRLAKKEKRTLLNQTYLSAGTFQLTDESSADRLIGQIQQNDFETYKVYVETDAGPAIQVWIAAGVNDANAIASKMPTLSLASTNPSNAYLIQKTRVVPSSATAYDTTDRYWLNPNGSKLYVSSAKNMSVEERYNRTYRGVFEITGYKNELTLVNELPFEQYLYSVVSSEMGGSFPPAALQAQAVAARTYAISKGMKYGIANISDTVYDQAYKGVGTESENCIDAVKKTDSMLMMYKGKLAVPYYSSNAGGITAENAEVWNGTEGYLGSAASPDQVAEKDKKIWYRVVLASGIVGYVREDLVTDTGAKTPSGLAILTPNTSGVNVRPVPSIRSDLPTDTAKIATVNPGDKLIVIEQRKEWNAYSWVTGLMTGKQLQDKINSKGLSYKNANKQWVTYKLNKPVSTLAITKKGKSGRPIEIEANGSLIPVSSPDNYRSVLGLLTSLWSTRFEVDNTGSYTILGANGKQVSYPATNGDLYALNATTAKPKAIEDAFIAMNNNDTPRYMTITPSFRFIGFGFGHGLGMSQWGAMGLAQYPTYYNYKQILMHYYPSITIEKGTSS